jgi:bifunctional non-homologous end joining protein LigD
MIAFTHLDKLYWPKEKLTKGALLEYYATLAPYILPYLKNRPLVMHRFPEGVQQAAFYQKEAGNNLPGFVKTVDITHESKKVRYILLQNIKTLLYVANLGCIELHPFNSTIKHLDYPDYMVLDLDPESISFSAVIQTAHVLHEILEELKVPHFCKTSGMSGLHLYVPMHAQYRYDQVRQFATLIANLAHQHLPELTSLERNPRKRQKKVYIDTLQNVKGQTLISAYAVRGSPQATVSTPLLWKEIKAGLDPSEFTILTVPKRISQLGDIFKPVLGKELNLPKVLSKIEKLTH